MGLRQNTSLFSFGMWHICIQLTPRINTLQKPRPFSRQEVTTYARGVLAVLLAGLLPARGVCAERISRAGEGREAVGSTGMLEFGSRTQSISTYGSSEIIGIKEVRYDLSSFGASEVR
jgi:hypothetical protein